MPTVRCALLLLPLMAPVDTLAAQLVRGRVLDAVGSTPIVGALVELQDSTGQVLQRDLTSPSGTFRFTASANGNYRVRAAAIGYSVTPPAVVALSMTDAVVHDFHLSPAVAILSDVVVAASKRRICGLGILDDPVFGRVFEGARTSLTVMETGIRSSTHAFPVELVRTTTVNTTKRPIVRADTTPAKFSKWPVESLDPELLRLGGFARMLDAGQGTGREYYGPDLRVLFAEWFLEGHCYTFAPAKKEMDDGMVRITFEPKGKSARVDLAGELLIDPTTLALRALRYEHRNLPSHIKVGTAGGEMQFAQIESGAWMPTFWRIHAPIEVAVRGGSPSRVTFVGPLPPRGSMTRPALQRAVAGSVELSGRLLPTVTTP